VATPAPVRLAPFVGFDLEVSAPCNAKCSFCPQRWRGVRRRRPTLEPTLVDRLASEIAAVLRVQRRQHRRARAMVGFCGMGEPLLQKHSILRFLERFEGGADLVLVTNGTYLTEDVTTHPLFDRLDRIVVSVTGWESSYEAIYRTDFARVRDNVVAAHGRHPGKVVISAVATPEVPQADVERAASFWRARQIPMAQPPLHSRGGHYKDAAAYPGATRDFATCSIFADMNFISSDGELLACCHDVTSAHVIGDVAREPLLELIARKRRRQAEARAFSVCTGCTDFTDFSGG